MKGEYSMTIDYSEHDLCDNCCIDYKKDKLDLYDIWIEGERMITLCDNCIDKMMKKIKILKGE